jgi:hypothetical protein
MTITKSEVAKQLSSYLNHQLSKEDLIAWCEHHMQESSFESDGTQEIVARLGLMDATNFDVSYEELSEMLIGLGYTLRVELI